MVKNYLKLMLAIVLTSQAMAQAIPSNVPKDGLVGWWPFNGNANDESGNGNHGTVNGATLTVDRFGRSNNAYSFDNNIRSHISVANFPNLPSGSSNYSISGWFKNEGYNNGTIVFWGTPLHGQNCEIRLYGEVCINNSGIGGGWWSPSQVTYCESSMSDTDWHYVSLVYNVSKISLFIDGMQVGSILPGLKPNLNNENFTIGGQLWAVGVTNQFNDYFFQGKLDDIAIYNRALSEQEIKQLYEGCPRETATLNPTNGVVLKNSNPITLSASPSGGVFKGKAILNGDFTPKNATLGSNSFDYHFVNSQGCKDSTQFKVVVYDTLGTVCSSTDTLKIKVQLTTGIKAGQLTAMNVYPNPTSDV